MASTVQLVMAALLFLVGLVMIGSGLFIILAREYQETMRTLSSQAPKLTGKAVNEGTVMAALEGTTRLLEAVTQLIRTAVGVGAFLCILGLIICVAAFYMATLAA
ncbi:hypothetical protein [Kallotenue papyrolyticum]|uniref:hypothetical protein n=1 Tax=Kallotenue papyrolyticum TaxID=1325125 RepID=UPI0004785C32|nr:hypothetical protein [Kallotenue papyrolyticum]